MTTVLVPRGTFISPVADWLDAVNATSAALAAEAAILRASHAHAAEQAQAASRDPVPGTSVEQPQNTTAAEPTDSHPTSATRIDASRDAQEAHDSGSSSDDDDVRPKFNLLAADTIRTQARTSAVHTDAGASTSAAIDLGHA